MTRRALAVTVLLALLVSAPSEAQTRRKRVAAKPAATKVAAPVTAPAALECPSPLGIGLSSKLAFCDMLTGRDAAGGAMVSLPPHVGPVTLSFTLHNRHTYSEELVKAKTSYRRYTATIGVLTADNTLLTRVVIQSEFRTGADLVERIGGGAGPGGAKAVAPTGAERFSVEIPEEEERVSLLGEKLTVVRPDGTDNFTAAGRPIALVSDVQITYRPKAAKAAARPKARTR